MAGGDAGDGPASGEAVSDWLYEHRPGWLGRIAGWLFWNTQRPAWASPYLLGLMIGRRPRRME